ncbi:MAG: hypothetical protein IPI50_02025 [Saprospiraceae bacterium]|nr:hypothetical protein [Saprospiraceae bacterium]
MIQFKHLTILLFFFIICSKLYSQNDKFLKAIQQLSNVEKFTLDNKNFDAVSFSVSFEDTFDSIVTINEIETKLSITAQWKRQNNLETNEVFEYSFDKAGKNIFTQRDSFDSNGFKVLSEEIWAGQVGNLMNKTMLVKYDSLRRPFMISKRKCMECILEPNFILLFFESGLVKEIKIDMGIGKLNIIGREEPIGTINYLLETEMSEEFMKAMGEMEEGKKEEDPIENYILKKNPKTGITNLEKTSTDPKSNKKRTVMNANLDPDLNLIEIKFYSKDGELSTHNTYTYNSKKQVLNFRNHISNQAFTNEYNNSDKPVKVYDEWGGYAINKYDKDLNLISESLFFSSGSISNLTVYKYE